MDKKLSLNSLFKLILQSMYYYLQFAVLTVLIQEIKQEDTQNISQNS